MTEPPWTVRLERVTKRFGRHVAVEDLDLEIPRGSIYGLLGPNGSGKTTTLRAIMGIVHPDAGTVRLFSGVSGGDDPERTRRERVGYLPEERGVYRKMKATDFLLFMAEIRGVERAVARRRAGGWLERLGLDAWGDRRVEDLSKGMQQKVQFVATVIHDPALLVLDEPFSGLDPINQDALEEIVREFHARGATILLSTHLMDQAERLCERVCLISRARKVLDGELSALKAAERRGVVALEVSGDDGWIPGPEVLGVERRGPELHVLLRDGADPQGVLRRGVAAGATIRRFDLVEPRLHEIFVRHAGADAAADAGLPPGVESAAGPATGFRGGRSGGVR